MMWARIGEVGLALWLAMSPFIFRYGSDATFFWWNDYICALAIGVISFTSFAHRLRKLHLLNVVVAAWLIGYGWFNASGEPPPVWTQNYIVVGILLVFFAILPTPHDEPPVPWQEFYRERAKATGEPAAESSGRE